jgi:NAD(P)-dependent dehydrogenase (short-subunit alcohol dehydrogenase family)
MSQKIALVTGGTRGIGAGISLALKAAGYTVAANYATNHDAAQAFSKDTGIPVYSWDVADFASCQDGVRRLVSDLGEVSILVNNAGITRDTLAMRMSSDDWDVVLQTNLKGAFNFTRAILRAMVKQRSGRIINISSVSGLMGLAGQANYAASKAGLIGMTKSIARETDMTSVLNEEVRKGALSQIPVARFGATDDIAAAVSFLASAEASYISGQVLAVDGGMSM